jgi:GxxExxY protein
MRIVLPEDPITDTILAAAFRVHSLLGPGLLESAYKACLAQRLRSAGSAVAAEVEIPLYFEGVYVDVAYRMDLLVDESVVVEVKSVEKIRPVHVAQLLSHLRIADKRVGLLLNFNVRHLREGIKRVINGHASISSLRTNAEMR